MGAKRVTLLQGSLLLLLLMVVRSAMSDETDEDKTNPTVKIWQGQLEGLEETSTKGRPFFSFRGIPFAEPPVGELRFKDPVSSGRWNGVYEAKAFRQPCMQLDMFPLLQGRHEIIGSEDCLYLNVYTPQIPVQKTWTVGQPTGGLPVMVFIHGGGFTCGTSLDYEPYVFLNEDVVLVTIHYRLGVFGFLSTEDSVIPGNFGLKDQKEALLWVQRNIASFGGDPLKVTLFGESAGASSAHWQMLSPKTVGLFSKAILMSGSALAPWGAGDAFLDVARFLGSIFNCTVDEGSEVLLECLQSLDAREFTPSYTAYLSWFLNPMLLGPRVDNDYLPDYAEVLIKHGNHPKIDIMTGITEHEGAILTHPIYTHEYLRSALSLNFPAVAPVALEFGEGDIAPLNQTVKIFDRYLGGNEISQETADNLTKLFGDRYFNIPHDLSALYNLRNAPTKKTFLYELKHRGQHSLGDIYDIEVGKNWTSHSDDLFYLFEGGVFMPLEKEEDLQLRDLMVSMWTNFAKSGDPTPGDDLGFKWEPAEESSLRHLVLQPKPIMEDDTRKEIRDFWFSLPTRQNIILHRDRVQNLHFVPVTEEKEEEKSSSEDTKDSTGEKKEENDTRDVKENKKDEL
ncbi:esterase E4-like isoform X3 [Oratosquilla oratoria]